MNDQRLATAPGGPDMGAKALPLPVQITGQAEVIQPGFTDRHHLGMGSALQQGILTQRLALGMIGMYPDRGKKIVITLGQRHHPRPVRQIDADAQCMTDAMLLHGQTQVIHLAVVVGEIDMAVRINQHGASMSFVVAWLIISPLWAGESCVCFFSPPSIAANTVDHPINDIYASSNRRSAVNSAPPSHRETSC